MPSNPARRDERCSEVYEIQVQGLATRLRATGIKRVVIGVSGGLDSTQALLVCAQAMDLLGYPRANILGYTMPGFATSARTLEQARRLMYGDRMHLARTRYPARRASDAQGHRASLSPTAPPFTTSPSRTCRRVSAPAICSASPICNGALVVGTGDLSELALGWCTYGVGDHMSHYAVNASVPKTLIQHLIRWVAAPAGSAPKRSATLHEILATPISPELVPGGDDVGGPAQDTEAMIGPYELHDFSLYYTCASAIRRPKVAFLAYCAWHDRASRRMARYSARAIATSTRSARSRRICARFFSLFQTSQFKRSAIPNSPKVGSGGSLSPRGDWRAPSDSEAAAWLAALDLVPERE